MTLIYKTLAFIAHEDSEVTKMNFNNLKSNNTKNSLFGSKNLTAFSN